MHNHRGQSPPSSLVFRFNNNTPVIVTPRQPDNQLTSQNSQHQPAKCRTEVSHIDPNIHSSQHPHITTPLPRLPQSNSTSFSQQFVFNGNSFDPSNSKTTDNPIKIS